jgi:transposase
MPRHRAPYPPEFRAEAVRLVRAGGRSPKELAQDLGCSDQTIRNWLTQADLDDGRRTDGLTTAERAELAQLRREVRVLREEREILRKAATFFAKEATR